MNQLVTLTIHYENGTAVLYDIVSFTYFRTYPTLKFFDGFTCTTRIVTLSEAVQICSRLGL